ncbi:hypothetical protein JWG41_01270 [Leptospira sp. 201903075]|uniref:hypothetical protein n=1 Tax=Leptospira chreensis TaxID=2810035 RepID=UPI001962FBF3|nr:hypothetical protein [Leptospira chreensis]MBM9589059.1 hypothetical protein [Leptospira chreensis]
MLQLIRKIRSWFFDERYRILHAFNVYKIKFPRLIIKTSVSIPDSFAFDEKIAIPRGRQAPDGNHYSFTHEITWSALPLSVQKEIFKFESVLRLYFGGDFLIHIGNIWRNIGIPTEFSSLDIYSQVWHYDHVFDYKNAQLFIILSDTTEEHGPFEFFKYSDEKSQYAGVENRQRDVEYSGEVEKLTGNRGDALLFATGSIPHRAGIPKFGNHRDMFSIAFFPKYTNIGEDANLLFKELKG